MEMNMAKFSEKLHELVEMGKKKKNVLEYKEINEVLKDMELDSMQWINSTNILKLMELMCCVFRREIPMIHFF